MLQKIKIIQSLLTTLLVVMMAPLYTIDICFPVKPENDIQNNAAKICTRIDLSQYSKASLDSILMNTVQTMSADADPLVVNLLLAVGANPNARNPLTKVPVAYTAISRLNLPVFKALVKAGADINAPDRLGRKALDWAKVNHSPSIENYILSLHKK